MSDINKQEELDWFIGRAGRLTCSIFGNLIKGKPGSAELSRSKTSLEIIYEQAMLYVMPKEKLGDAIGRAKFTSKYTDHGDEYEPHAIRKYIEVTGFKVRYHNKFWKYLKWLGGTPDAYADDGVSDGLVEVKCPFRLYKYPIQLRELKKIKKEDRLKEAIDLYERLYFWQVHGQMMVTDKKWCDFVVYEPTLDDIVYFRIYRDEKVIEEIQRVMGEAVVILEETIDMLNENSIAIGFS